MLIAEKEYKDLRKLKSWTAVSLTKVALECQAAPTSRASVRTMEKLYKKLREAHQTHQAAHAAVELAENYTVGFEAISEALDIARSEAKEKRERQRYDVVDCFTAEVIDRWELPSEFVRALRRLLEEIFAIRDAIDPPRAEGIRTILDEMEHRAEELSSS